MKRPCHFTRCRNADEEPCTSRSHRKEYIALSLWHCPSPRVRRFLASPGKRSTTSSMGNRASAPRWQSGSRRHSAARRKHGYGCSLPMISHRPARTKAKSRSAASTYPRNSTRSDANPDDRVWREPLPAKSRDHGRDREAGAGCGQRVVLIEAIVNLLDGLTHYRSIRIRTGNSP